MSSPHPSTELLQMRTACPMGMYDSLAFERRQARTVAVHDVPVPELPDTINLNAAEVQQRFSDECSSVMLHCKNCNLKK